MHVRGVPEFSADDQWSPLRNIIESIVGEAFRLPKTNTFPLANNQPVIPDTLLHLKVTELPMFLLLCVMIIFAVIIVAVVVLNIIANKKVGKKQ